MRIPGFWTTHALIIFVMMAAIVSIAMLVLAMMGFTPSDAWDWLLERMEGFRASSTNGRTGATPRPA
jgi:hypothetical protein